MRRFVAVVVALATACGESEREHKPADAGPPSNPETCESDSDCLYESICGEGSGRVVDFDNRPHAYPDNSMFAQRANECLPVCESEVTDDCALPSCPADASELQPLPFNHCDCWYSDRGIRLSYVEMYHVLTCDSRQGVVDFLVPGFRVQRFSLAWHSQSMMTCSQLYSQLRLSEPTGQAGLNCEDISAAFPAAIERWPYSF